MKKVLFLAFIALTITASAQTTEGEESLKAKPSDTLDGWKFGGVLGVNYSQVSLSNWAAGGESSVSLNSLADLSANLIHGKSHWDNTLTLGYGESRIGGGEWEKSDDRIMFNSKYGRQAHNHWYYAGLVNFKSQFAQGFESGVGSPVISDFLAPGYLIGALGMDYKPHDNFSLFVAPLTVKATFVRNERLADQGAFGVEEAEYDALGNKTKNGEDLRLEYGGYLRMVYKTEIMENITYQTNLDLFSNYSEDPDHVDVNWDNLLALKVNRFITTTIATTLIYDHDIQITETKTDGTVRVDQAGNPIIGPRTQFKYVLTVGFQYNFGTKKE